MFRTRSSVPPTARPTIPATESILVSDLVGGPAGAFERRRAIAHLDTLPQPDRARILGEFFQSKRDANLGQRFAVGPDGYLIGTPTLRVAMLDLSEQVAPQQAAELAASVVADSQSADEWAVALRILGRRGQTPVHRALLLQKTRELLANRAWLAAPTDGFLQAFDAAVFAQDATLLGTLAPLVSRDQRREVRWAAFIAADRLASANPSATATYLNSQPGLFGGEPEIRAGLFARLDVRSPEHRAALETYLQRQDITAVERRHFAELFPNHNTTWSNNLLSQNFGRTIEEMAVVDRMALHAIADWRNDSRFAVWLDLWPTMNARLEAYLQDAPPTKG